MESRIQDCLGFPCLVPKITIVWDTVILTSNHCDDPDVVNVVDDFKIF